MSKEEIFLDSCVFFSYAYIFEDFSNYSEMVFNDKKYNRYTGETVIEELVRRKERRDQAYPLFLEILIKGGNLEEISEKLGIYLSRSDLEHFKSLRDYLVSIAKDDLPAILKQLGRWKLISDARFKKAETGLIRTVPKYNDTYLKNLINSIINNDFDSRIVVEAFDWSRSIDNPKFVTIDSKDIYKNSQEILEKLKNYKSLGQYPFNILHVIEIATS